ncbi:MAG: hypothetical protein ACJ8E1_02010 [Xanthobacteraceae bacterium]|jgi:hypothetical protein
MAEPTNKKAEPLKALEGMVRRQAMRIIEIPKMEREQHYQIMRESLAEALDVYKVPPDEALELVDLLVRMIEALALEMEAGGAAKPRRAP